ncbi:hypothetical protein AB3R30_04605 [Leptolyngbyaceae cyanobacterium UHCC 1019]
MPSCHWLDLVSAVPLHFSLGDRCSLTKRRSRSRFEVKERSQSHRFCDGCRVIESDELIVRPYLTDRL